MQYKWAWLQLSLQTETVKQTDKVDKAIVDKWTN